MYNLLKLSYFSSSSQWCCALRRQQTLRLGQVRLVVRTVSCDELSPPQLTAPLMWPFSSSFILAHTSRALPPPPLTLLPPQPKPWTGIHVLPPQSVLLNKVNEAAYCRALQVTCSNYSVCLYSLMLFFFWAGVYIEKYTWAAPGYIMHPILHTVLIRKYRCCTTCWQHHVLHSYTLLGWGKFVITRPG